MFNEAFDLHAPVYASYIICSVSKLHNDNTLMTGTILMESRKLGIMLYNVS